MRVAVDFIFFNTGKSLLQDGKPLGVQKFVYCKPFPPSDTIPASHAHFSTAHLIRKPNAKEVQKMKGKVDYIVAEGGSIEMNRFAAVTRGVDYLLAPCSAGKLVFDTAIGRMCREYGKKILVPFSDFLQVKGFERAMLFKNYFMTVKIANKYHVPVQVVSAAHHRHQLRSAEDLAALGHMLGVKYPIPP